MRNSSKRPVNISKDTALYLQRLSIYQCQRTAGGERRIRVCRASFCYSFSCASACRHRRSDIVSRSFIKTSYTSVSLSSPLPMSLVAIRTIFALHEPMRRDGVVCPLQLGIHKPQCDSNVTLSNRSTPHSICKHLSHALAPNAHVSTCWGTSLTTCHAGVYLEC